MVRSILPSSILLFTASCGGFAARREADYTEPYLDEDMMRRFVESLREEDSALESVLAGAAADDDRLTTASLKAEARLPELESFARQHGFRDYDQYLAVWKRAAIGKIQLRTKKEVDLLNAPDLELVRKFDAPIEEALSRFKKPAPAAAPKTPQ